MTKKKISYNPITALLPLPLCYPSLFLLPSGNHEFVLYYLWVYFFWFCSLVCFLDSTYKWCHTLFAFVWLSSFLFKKYWGLLGRESCWNMFWQSLHKQWPFLPTGASIPRICWVLQIHRALQHQLHNHQAGCVNSNDNINNKNFSWGLIWCLWLHQMLYMS